MIESKFWGKKILKRPTCPFCGMFIERPKELSTRMPGEMPVGSCSCGAVYSCDETGHNLGSAMLEALLFGCNMDTDLALGILPEEDYIEEIVEKYDYINHLIVPGGSLESRRISGALYFIRMHNDIQEVTSQGVQKRLDQATPVIPKKQKKQTIKKPLSKNELEELVKEFRIDPILRAAGEDKKLIWNLQRLLYSGDNLFRKRAAEIMGQVSAVIAETNPGDVSKLLQRLFTSIVDTAAFTWGAFEAIGEIISYKPNMFAGYIPQLYQFLADETRRVQVIQTIARIANARPDLIRNTTFHFIPLLQDSDPLTRGYTAWLLGNLGASEAQEDLKNLLEDSHEIDIYEDGNLEKKTVAQIALEALNKL
jgi:HEAT repeat protein